MKSSNKVVQRALSARLKVGDSACAVNMSRRVKGLMYSAYDHMTELLIDLKYVRELIAKTEADENEDVKMELPKLDRIIEQARQMQRAWLRR